ncbi:MAG: ATP-binding protein [Clostridia bacterium]|nr:ATP-binding protein [Clostridia bacterium]
MIIREKYLNQIRPFVDSDLIKIITGIRRCGKSVIMLQLKEELLKKTNNVIYIDFESIRIKNIIKNVFDLLDYIDKCKTNKDKYYIFIDEIQNLNDWPDACKTLRLENNSVFITGSNSKLLSGEFTKELSGRYVSFRIRPFVYSEISEYAKELGKSYTVNDYLIWGGFPKSIEYDGEEKKNYIYDLEETIIHNDICLRYNIKKDNIFRAVCDFIFRSNSRIISAKSITNYIKANNEPCSINTVIKYIDYLAEAFGIDLVKEYSTKIKKKLSYYYKVYNADVSFNSIRVMDNRYDLDHNLENIVYNELLFKGYNVQVYRYNNYEIDFFVTKNGKSHYIQVAYSVVDNKAYEREFKAFNKMDYTYDKILITNDIIDYSTSMVRHIKFKDFLMIDEL